jgi:hypothetical protein
MPFAPASSVQRVLRRAARHAHDRRDAGGVAARTWCSIVLAATGAVLAIEDDEVESGVRAHLDHGRDGIGTNCPSGVLAAMRAFSPSIIGPPDVRLVSPAARFRAPRHQYGRFCASRPPST